MATSPYSSPDQGQGSAPQGGGASSAPDQGQQSGAGGQANDMQMLLAKWYQAAKQMGASDPKLAAGAQKVAEGIQMMQTALITPSQPQPSSQQPPQ